MSVQGGRNTSQAPLGELPEINLSGGKNVCEHKSNLTRWTPWNKLPWGENVFEKVTTLKGH